MHAALASDSEAELGVGISKSMTPMMSKITRQSSCTKKNTGGWEWKKRFPNLYLQLANGNVERRKRCIEAVRGWTGWSSVNISACRGEKLKLIIQPRRKTAKLRFRVLLNMRYRTRFGVKQCQILKTCMAWIITNKVIPSINFIRPAGILYLFTYRHPDLPAMEY